MLFGLAQDAEAFDDVFGDEVQMLRVFFRVLAVVVAFAAFDVTGEALSALVVNKMRGVLDVVAIKAPGFGNRRREYTQDIAIATGASFVAEELGITLDSVTIDMLGDEFLETVQMDDPIAIHEDGTVEVG